jgi:hypothetical protein
MKTEKKEMSGRPEIVTRNKKREGIRGTKPKPRDGLAGKKRKTKGWRVGPKCNVESKDPKESVLISKTFRS